MNRQSIALHESISFKIEDGIRVVAMKDFDRPHSVGISVAVAIEGMPNDIFDQVDFNLDNPRDLSIGSLLSSVTVDELCDSISFSEYYDKDKDRKVAESVAEAFALLYGDVE